MIQNLDSRINKLQAQCDYLRHKLSTFPEGELFIQKNGSYHRWRLKMKEKSVYCPKSNRSLAEVMALKKYYSLLLLEAEEELSLLNFYKKIFSLQTVPGLYLPPIFCRNPLPTTNCCKVIFRRISFRYRCRNGVRKLMRRMGRIRSI